MALMFLATTQLMAAFKTDGTADSSGDGDGDPLTGNGFEYLATSNGFTNKHRPQSSLDNTEWWISNTQVNSWEDYVATGDDGKYVAAHLRDPVATGGSFWIGESYEYGVVEYKNQFRESLSNLPDDTELYLGFSSYGVAGGYTGVNTYLDPIGLTEVLFDNGDATTTIAPDGIVNDGAMDWHRYTIDDGATELFKIDLKDSGYPPLTEWIAYFVLPSAEEIVAGTDWASTDLLNDSPAPTVNDIVFSWTTDSKTKKAPFSTTPNPNYQNPIDQVPEPDTAIYGSFIAALLILRRRRK